MEFGTNHAASNQLRTSSEQAGVMEFGFYETTERNAHIEEFREFGKDHTLPGCAPRPALVAGEGFGLMYPHCYSNRIRFDVHANAKASERAFI